MDVVIGIDSTCWLVQPDSWCGGTCPAKTTLINQAAVVSYVHCVIPPVMSLQTVVCGSCRPAGVVRWCKYESTYRWGHRSCCQKVAINSSTPNSCSTKNKYHAQKQSLHIMYSHRFLYWYLPELKYKVKIKKFKKNHELCVKQAWFKTLSMSTWNHS